MKGGSRPAQTGKCDKPKASAGKAPVIATAWFTKLFNIHISKKSLTGHGGMSFGSTELFLSHIFIGDRLDNIRPCDEQVWRVLNTQTQMFLCILELNASLL